MLGQRWSVWHLFEGMKEWLMDCIGEWRTLEMKEWMDGLYWGTAAHWKCVADFQGSLTGLLCQAKYRVPGTSQTSS